MILSLFLIFTDQINEAIHTSIIINSAGFIRMYFEEIFGLPCDCQELKISWKALLQLTVSLLLFINPSTC